MCTSPDPGLASVARLPALRALRGVGTGASVGPLRKLAAAATGNEKITIEATVSVIQDRVGAPEGALAVAAADTGQLAVASVSVDASD